MNLRILLALAAAALLAWSFWHNGAWLQLCAGLAVFLFGMQILEEGLKQLAGGSLERLLARGTSTPLRGLLFGVAGTAALQSSTLVSLLAIAFISSGLIQLAGGIAIIFGANLGATSGIWLLALAGQNLSLSPLALPMLVFGVLAGIAGERCKAAGRVVLGVALVFLGIDQIKAGFDGFGGGFDLDQPLFVIRQMPAQQFGGEIRGRGGWSMHGGLEAGGRRPAGANPARGRRGA